MDLTKILEKLGVQALDESAKADVTKFITEMIDLKSKERAKELSEEVLAEEKTKLVEDFEAKFADYKEEVLSKWSDFVDGVIEEEVKIPENVLEFAKYGEQYKPIMDKIRMSLAIDEGTVDSEAKKLLGEAKAEIEKLRTKVNSLMKENMEIKEDAKSMAVHIHLRKKCDGLTEAQKKTVMDMLGDLTSVAQINEKFDFVVENFLLIEKKGKKKKDDDDDDEKGCDSDNDADDEPNGDEDKKGFDVDKKGTDGDDMEKSSKEAKKDKKGQKAKESGKGLSESADLPSNWDKLMENYAATAKKVAL